MRKILFLIILLITTFLVVGCGDDEVAYVSKTTDEGYERTFDNLKLGDIDSFNLELSNPNKRRVKIWGEEYHDGILVKPTPLIVIDYSPHTDKDNVNEIAVGMIKGSDNKKILFIYGENDKDDEEDIVLVEAPKELRKSKFNNALEDKGNRLKLGEEKVIGMYRYDNQGLKDYDKFSNKDIKTIISEDDRVLIFKIMIN